MTENGNDKKPEKKSSGRWGISRYWWALIIVVALGYMFGKDLALNHNKTDQANAVSAGQ